MSLSAAELPEGAVGEPYSSYDFRLTTQVQGDPAYSSHLLGYSVAAGTLPEGLNLSADGTLSGTPVAGSAGQHGFTVLATYKGETGQQVYTIEVGGVTLRVVQISAGDMHTCAVTTAGAAMCWGSGVGGDVLGEWRRRAAGQRHE